MNIRNYWWLLIWPFLYGGISLNLFPKKREYVLGHYVFRWTWLSALLLAAPYVLWAADKSDRYGDKSQYRITFLSMPTGLSNMAEYVARRSKGKGFVVFEYLFKTLISNSDTLFFVTIAFIQIFFVVRIYRKYSCNYWLSMFFFVASAEYLSWVHNGIRQFIAVTIIFTCLPLLLKKKYILMCVVVLIAALFHSTALVFLPFIFVINGRAWNTRTILYIVAIVLSVIFLEQVTGMIVEAMRETVYEGDIAIFESDDGTNFLRVLFHAVPTIMAWVYKPYIDKANDPMINMCVNLSIITSGVYVFSYFTSGILVGAVPIYFSLTNYILIPWIIDNVFDSETALLVSSVFIGVYSVFFYYQCGPTWGLL